MNKVEMKEKCLDLFWYLVIFVPPAIIPCLWYVYSNPIGFWQKSFGVIFAIPLYVAVFMVWSLILDKLFDM